MEKDCCATYPSKKTATCCVFLLCLYIILWPLFGHLASIRVLHYSLHTMPPTKVHISFLEGAM